MQQLQSVWNALDGKRRIMAVGSSVAMFAMIMMLVKVATAPGMSLLYSGLEEAAAGEIIQTLEARGIAYDVRADAIFVPSRVRDETRLMLAANGLPANSHSGYELLESLTGFGTTSQMFDAAYWRAKEGELARTIVASPHIRTARVHIAQASSSGFRRDGVPTASVTVTTTSAALNAAQARAIRYLVASAVAGMTPEHVSVIDGAGGLVYGPEADVSIAGSSSDRTQELRRNVERLLEAHVGHGRAVVELSIETLTDKEVIHERRIDPETRVAISSEVEENNSTSTDSRQQGVTVASNLPDGDAAAVDGSAESRETQTRQRTNFEVSETRREIERNPGSIRRMTVAVLIDGVRSPAEDGTISWAPRPPEELEALRELVASAVGFDEERGDVITLRSLPFEPVAAIGTEARTGFLSLNNLDLMSLIKWAFLLAALIVIALFVLRPILRAIAESKGDAVSGGAFDSFSPTLLETSNAGPTEFDAIGNDAFAPTDDPVERMRRLIAERGDDSVQVLRHWMDERKEPS
ncbi:flagellar basal-body MS-ring/collar protein FliF [Roseinatronobacter sp.]|uniref:flagellar basal-body MS-ring/collar protein FliF n=1 Tax=Roseinatronobacter sp. TaxID=1945755 RepID=UPI0025E6CAD2|nr:flagellar basal-body MS-ring/collar protein FliF [Rhodobaca sp.]